MAHADACRAYNDAVISSHNNVESDNGATYSGGISADKSVLPSPERNVQSTLLVLARETDVYEKGSDERTAVRRIEVLTEWLSGGGR
jgi:hypothetical protein